MSTKVGVNEKGHIWFKSNDHLVDIGDAIFIKNKRKNKVFLW